MAIATKDLAVDCLARARALAAVSPAASPSVRDDMLRSALVMGVAAVDTLMHTVVFRAIENDADTLPAAIGEKLTIGFGEVARFADAAKAAQRNKKMWRPWVQVKNLLHARLLRQTMQSPREIEDAMAMAGIKKGWTSTADAMGESVSAVKTMLGKIVQRRNQIVHEGDFQRLVRPQKIRLRVIDQAAVAADLVWLGRLIDALAAVADAPG